MKLPTRPLIGPKPLRYVSAISTDIRRTFRRFRLLERIRDQGSDRASGSDGLGRAVLA
jgi:hypothetical protein